MQNDPRLLLLSQEDNILVLRNAVEAGETIYVEYQQIRLPIRISLGHKIARQSIKKGDKVIKYGVPIGSASCYISRGEFVHLHNLQSNYTPTYALEHKDNDYD